MESKKRSINKTISWRIVAVVNSWIVLASVLSEVAWINALLMNLSGAVLYYIHERIWSNR